MHWRKLGFVFEVLGTPPHPSGAADTRNAARAMIEARVDVLVFAGGDGTARDLAEVVPPYLPVIGVPAGVKMHSGVFVVRPRDAAELIALLLDGGLVAAQVAQVRDIDEVALRQGRMATRYIGELGVPRVGGFLQHVKSAGREVEELVLAEIAENVVRTNRRTARIDRVGSGQHRCCRQTPPRHRADVARFRCHTRWRACCRGCRRDAARRAGRQRHRSRLSFTRGQGFLIGRGNQQLTPAILRTVQRDNIWIVASRTKLLSLDGRPLLVDSGADDVDARLQGVVEIISGYEDALFYRVGRQTMLQ